MRMHPPHAQTKWGALEDHSSVAHTPYSISASQLVGGEKVLLLYIFPTPPLPLKSAGWGQHWLELRNQWSRV